MVIRAVRITRKDFAFLAHLQGGLTMSESTELIQLQEQPTLSIRGQVLIAALATAQGERLRALKPTW